MKNSEHTTPETGWRLIALVILALTLSFGVHAPRAFAAVNCATVTDPTADSDQDGLTDYLECHGITLADGTAVPSCVTAPAGTIRSSCLDPNSKDLFAVYAPAPSGSLLPAVFPP